MGKGDCLKSLLTAMGALGRRPELFEPGEAMFWDDPHIAGSMLAAHLDSDADGASRRKETIDRTVEHLVSGVLAAGARVLDLGCGPGLYSSRLAKKGFSVTGIDISRNSIAYARQAAVDEGLEIEYRLQDFFTIDYEEKFDYALQVYGELCTFADEARDRLLGIIRRSLKAGGRLIFDVSTRDLRWREGLKNGWRYCEGGFWRPGRHVVLEQGFDYPGHDTWLDQYVVIDETAVTVYRLWFHDYSLDTVSRVLAANGFAVEEVWNDLTGTPYREGGDWIAIVARKL